MQEIICLKSINFTIDKEEVFLKIECNPDSPAYGAVEACYKEIYEDVCAALKPAALLARAVLPKEAGAFAGREAVYEILTVGDEVSRYITSSFAQGDYVRGMLADAMADSALFSLEHVVSCSLISYCKRLKRGISRRLEAPANIGLEVHKDAFEKTEAKKHLCMRLSEGFMFEPVKSVCNIFLLSQNEKEFRVSHECSMCKRKDCPMRKKTIEQCVLTIVQDNKAAEKLLCKKGETVLDALSKYHKEYEAVCGGTGRCGKCKIIVEQGEAFVSEADRRFFTKKELLLGWRLACTSVIQGDMSIKLKMNQSETMDAVSDFVFKPEEKDKTSKGRKNHFAFAVDIGTTTIAVSLIRLSDGRCLETYTRLNRQRMYGADVISRIQKAGNGGVKELQALIWEDIAEAVGYLAKRHLMRSEKYDGRTCTQSSESLCVEKITAAANTTMLHLLMGYPCGGLGQAPFTPHKIGSERLLAAEFSALMQKISKEVPREKAAAFHIFHEKIFDGTGFEAFPGISAFVGADIAAGMCALDMGQDEGVDMLIDLGTNGEMAIGGKEKILVASAAAGPAFEGGNITWGTGSIPGAICHVRMENGRLLTETIQNGAPKGLCGTGLVEAVHALVTAGRIDETGLLRGPYFENGYPLAETADGQTICLTQKDIREFQMAKAAIWAGAKTLIEKYGVSAGGLRHVYIAGGFGYRLDYKKAVEIGLLPESFKDKICPVGNSALRGAVLLAENENILEKAEAIVSRCEEVSLAGEAKFHEYYMEGMYF